MSFPASHSDWNHQKNNLPLQEHETFFWALISICHDNIDQARPGVLGIRVSWVFYLRYTLYGQWLWVFGILFRLQFWVFGINQISEKHDEYFKNTLDFDFRNICDFAR